MATPIIDSVSKDLAYKLQDPVTAGNVNGIRISAAERFRYILRAYRRLVRFVTLLFPNEINTLFPMFFTVINNNTNASGLYFLDPYFLEVYEVLAKEHSQEDYERVTYIEPTNWLSIEKSINAFYNPDLNTRTYYWTLLQQYLQIAPPTAYNIRISIRVDWPKHIENNGQGGSYDLDIPTEHIDLLLSLACSEAYLDIGQADLAALYLNDFNAHLQVLAQTYAKVDDKNEN